MVTADAESDAAAEPRRHRIAIPLTASALLAVATVYTAVGDPHRAGFFPACPYLVMTGLWCPGCGGLRAVHELANGDVIAALALNPVVVLVVIPLGVWLLLAWWRAGWRGASSPRTPAWAGITLFVGLLVFWVLRNIPALEPFLAP